MSLRLRLAALVGLASLVVLAVVGVALVATVSDRLHDTARRDAFDAVSRARTSLAVGSSTAQVTQVVPGMPIIQVTYARPVGVPDHSDEYPPGVGDQEEGSVHVDVGGPPFSGGPAAPGPGQLLGGLDPEHLPRDGEVLLTETEVAGQDVYQAVVAGVGAEGDRFVAMAAVPLTDIRDTVTALRIATIVMVPVVSVLLGALAAVIAGWALRPVARMRAEADAISHGTLHHRLTPAARSAELAGLAATMNAMLDRIERSSTSQRRLVSDVSHELRSPLATIRGTVELAVGRPGTIAESGPVALAEIDRLDDLVGDLLLLARLEEGGRVCAAEVDLDDVVRSQIATVAANSPPVDASAVEPVRLSGDRRALTGLVRNLVDNAVRHAGSGVSVSLSEEGGTIRLEVADDGPGVPADQRERIFDRFARLDDARSRGTGGTGLGLAVAAAAARAHGGTIRVDDAEGGGARFIVELEPAG